MDEDPPDDELHRRHEASQRAFHRALGCASPGAHVVDHDGVQATIVPAAARMALVNGVFYRDGRALEAALADVARAYDRAGVAHWGVWVPGSDAATARMLRDAGHTRRMAPLVMGRALAGDDLDRQVEVELDPAATTATVARCDDLAFGVEPAYSLVPAFQADAGTGMRAYAVRRDGELACGVIVRPEQGNLYAWGLAATPAARGAVLPIRLMRLVLRDARRSGCTTVTCETTPHGQAIAEYLRLRPVARWALWERRAR